ncbi:glycosyltransferase family protein [Thalictrum thalictroides]|uniref:Glycosyltransferase family protein n=1 Tax=Thalictrum thalictroides TaxID=46969 RepID=A0A7J6USQ7_THATH|nr:glycosyltransferase family protein [Thalictrum thalictroides]
MEETDDDSGVRSGKTVFVTVGTTSFDELVKAIDTREVKEELSRKGYTHILIQMGRGCFIPTKIFGYQGAANQYGIPQFCKKHKQYVSGVFYYSYIIPQFG